MKLSQSHRGIYQSLDVVEGNQRRLVYTIPLSEIIYNFFNSLKVVSRGYASMSYDLLDYEDTQQKLEQILNQLLSCSYFYDSWNRWLADLYNDWDYYIFAQPPSYHFAFCKSGSNYILCDYFCMCDGTYSIGNYYAWSENGYKWTET